VNRLPPPTASGAWSDQTERSRNTIKWAFIVGVVLAVIGRVALYVLPDTVTAIGVLDAYERGVAIGAGSYPDLLAKAFLTVVAIATVWYLNQNPSGDRRRTFLGNWWVLVIIPVLLDDLYDGFTGHTVITILYIYVAFRFWQGRENAWRWGCVVGVLTAWFAALDGMGHFLDGLGTGMLGGLLRGTSDLFILMLLLPLTYNTLLYAARKSYLMASLIVGAVGGPLMAVFVSVPGGFGLTYGLLSEVVPAVIFVVMIGLIWLGLQTNKSGTSM